MAANKRSSEIVNRKSDYEFFSVQTFQAGMVLTGTEVKSLREGKASFNDAFCYFWADGSLYIKNLHIAEYNNGTYNNHDSKRTRKLLLKKSELKKMQAKVKEKGYTVIPKRIYFSERGWAKIEIALAQGKKTYDKRDAIKDRDSQRDMQRELKHK